MNKPIEFYFDFGSPTSYLAYQRLQQLHTQYGVVIELKPVLLGGLFKGANNQSPAFVPLKAKWMDLDMRRYAQRFDISFQQNPFFPINTMLLMRGALVAEENSCLEQYVETVFNAMWCEAQNMEDPDTVATQLTSAGLDAKVLLEGTQQDHIKQSLKQRTAAALERDLFGCPTMFYDGEFFFGQDRIFFIEEMLPAQPEGAIH